jgi:hypothetical protein
MFRGRLYCRFFVDLHVYLAEDLEIAYMMESQVVLAENVIRSMIMVIERVLWHNRALEPSFRKVNYELGPTSSLP